MKVFGVGHTVHCEGLYTVRLMYRADSEWYFCWGYHNSEWWPSQSWASAAVMTQQIIRLFDDPSCLPHLCTQKARLPALTSVQRSRISLEGERMKKNIFTSLHKNSRQIYPTETNRNEHLK